jgi:hypothetical protein
MKVSQNFYDLFHSDFVIRRSTKVVALTHNNFKTSFPHRAQRFAAVIDFAFGTVFISSNTQKTQIFENIQINTVRV